jgi:hypothetical protein
MNEGEPIVHSDGQLDSRPQLIPERVQRRSRFNIHVASCHACGDDASALCDDGHRLLREAIDM